MAFDKLKKIWGACALLGVSLSLQPSFADSVPWKNLDKAHRLGGRQVSEGYMRGKLALVFCWGSQDEKCRALMSYCQSIWEDNKARPFVLLAGHRGKHGTAEAAKALMKEKQLTFPAYDGAALGKDEPETSEVPFFYIVDETGKVRYMGSNEHRMAERLVTYLIEQEQPKNAKLREHYTSWEVKSLPGQALLRIEGLRTDYPEEAKKFEADYERLKADVEVQKLAKLVAFARKAKAAGGGGTVGKADIEAALTENVDLKASKNPLVVQEAKNALADLRWELANF